MVEFFQEGLYYQDRLLLHKLRRQHPLWRLRDLAEAVGRSVSWVKKTPTAT
jgi:hypothetical protein